MVPPWTPGLPKEETADATAAGDAGADDDGGADQGAQSQSGALVSVAPAGRFAGARLNLGRYARSGDRGELRKALGHYIRKGYGGSKTALQRFGGTAATAKSLGETLARLADGQPTDGSQLDATLLSGSSSDEVMGAIVEAVRPIDGSQDAEAARRAIQEAMSELLGQFPDADLVRLNADQRDFVIEQFTANDVFGRFQLDIGQSIVEKAPSALEGLTRLAQARDYVKQAVAASFRSLRAAGKGLTALRIVHVVRDALRATFEVFEGYAT